jgi:hypothetical protein
VRAVWSFTAGAAERKSDAEHDEFGDGLDQQQSTIGAEDAQCAFGLTPPVKRQQAGDDFNQLKIFVCSRRKKRRVRPPSGGYYGKTADECCALERAAACRSTNEPDVLVHDR